MSRRRGEFEHRTSIFEGAFRAWSHLGGLEPHDLENKTASELDPLTNPLLNNDPRLSSSNNNKKKNSTNSNNDNDDTVNGGDTKNSTTGNTSKINNSDTSGGDAAASAEDKSDPTSSTTTNNNKNKTDNSDNIKEDKGESSTSGNNNNNPANSRREYPYEPLPRTGLSHPFVQAILSPWLGPDADQDAIQLGLTTLRTWWQHRRKGESGSAITALGTERMRGVVEGYTRHFFNLAHCLVTNDGEQPPRTLHAKMRDLEKTRAKNGLKVNKSTKVNNGVTRQNSNEAIGNNTNKDLEDLTTPSNLTPLERLHAAQRRQLEQNGGVTSSFKVNVKGKCQPGKADLAGIVDQVTLKAQQMTHRGTTGPSSVPSGKTLASTLASNKVESSAAYGDPNKTPVVFVSENGDIQIAMDIEGITCAHCVKIVETVLRGCNGNKSPIKGLLDAAADRALHAVLIKIDQSSNAKRIAFESARNLAMVGYTAKAKDMKIVDMYTPGIRGNPARRVELSMLSTAFEVVASVDRAEVFNWDTPCTCPDNGVLREDCPRHSQMNKLIFEAFDRREQQVSEFMAGCGKNIGMDCTCGPNCSCNHQCQYTCKKKFQQRLVRTHLPSTNHIINPTSLYPDLMSSNRIDNNINGNKISHDATVHQAALQQSVYNSQQVMTHQNQHDANMQQHNVTSGASVDHSLTECDSLANMTFSSNNPASTAGNSSNPMRTGRSNSISSWGSGRYGRNMSITSETTFGRAMSGLSALSIDWENMEDFDVNVDHSAHINNGPMNHGPQAHNSRLQTQREENTDQLGVLEHAAADTGSNHHMNHYQPHHTGGATRRRSSLKKNKPFDPNAANMQVSFQL